MKNKLLKFTSFVLAIAFALSMVVYAEESDVITTANNAKLTVTSASGDVGDVVEVSVVAENNPGIVVAMMGVGYDKTALKLVGMTDGGIWGENISAPEYDAVPYTLAWFNPTITENIKENGAIATLKFEILPEAKVGYHTVSLHIFEENADILDVDLNYVNFEKSNGVVTVGNPAEYDGSIPSDGSDEERKEDTIVMVIGESASFVNGKKTVIDSLNKQVVPYIKNDRTLVPLRFVSESIGAEVLWEDGWNYCLIKKDDKEIKITFGSAEFEVNGEKFTYEAPIETVYDRTMVPVRFISEHLGYNVYWQELNQAVVITPESNPWLEGRNAEETALMEMIVSIKGILP